MGAKKYARRLLVRKHKKNTLETPRSTSEDIQLRLKRTRVMASRGQDSSGLGSEKVVISSEHGNDAGSSIKCEEFD
jgi:hypothetical protein